MPLKMSRRLGSVKVNDEAVRAISRPRPRRRWRWWKCWPIRLAGIGGWLAFWYYFACLLFGRGSMKW